ncbi:FPGT [Mytilus edulis]|uniref:FPGT n=1 Tax=Mytilus edulis TaxID=6550 RepID=A0A8S3Q545_MYTED|nr:FPGT [Mytilus edulis]
MGDPGITTFMKNVLSNYSSIRGKDKDSGHAKFWDVVVITTADEDQKEIFDAQLKDKLDRKEVPLNLPIHIISDPPGTKLGNGGSTLTALDFLHTEYGDGLYDYRVLLLHAGGQSKRMPSASILGKIFSAIPTGNPLYQMLDFKLAMYWPFLPRMPAGVFLSCADDFLVYNLGDETLPWKFEETGFTALAHPSSIQIGTQHGVYVLENPENIDTSKHILNQKCIEVLQKPSETVMYKKDAVIKDKTLKFPGDIKVKGHVAYTDSSFFFGMDVTKKLIGFYKENSPITCEIDAYGDFLQALGPNATIDYTSHIPNVSNPTKSLIPTREKIFNLLKGTNISLLLMNSSRFIHIGTTQEFSQHFCFDKQFQEEVGLEMDVFNNWVENRESKDCSKKMKFSDVNQGCVMHSCLTSDSTVSPGTVVEYFHADIPVNIGQNSIISNCALLTSEVSESLNHCDVPHDLFLHTVPVFHNGSTMYVTIFFHVKDNLKKQAPAKDLIFLQRTLGDVLSICKLDIQKLANKGSGDEDNSGKLSLWTAPIYPLEKTMSKSFVLSMKTITKIRTENKSDLNLNDYSLVSIAEILKIKDFKTMLSFRSKLNRTICDNQ